MPMLNCYKHKIVVSIVFKCVALKQNIQIELKYGAYKIISATMQENLTSTFPNQSAVKSQIENKVRCLKFMKKRNGAI